MEVSEGRRVRHEVFMAPQGWEGEYVMLPNSQARGQQGGINNNAVNINDVK